MINELKFKATGVGSLPHKNAKDALELILSCENSICYWPQLPHRSKLESMAAQYLEGFDFLKVEENADVRIVSNIDKALEKFFEKVLSADFNKFAISPDYAQGLSEFLRLLENGKFADSSFVKGQVTGPFTFAGSITGPDNRAIIYDSMLMDAVVSGLGLKAAWQKEQFKKFGKKCIISFDEPYLSCFGSAFTPINQEDVVKRLTDLITPLKDEDCLIGIHCCGNTDWAMLLNIGFDIINFDAYEFSDKFLLYPNEIQAFLEKGGIIAWGLVPTNEFPKGLKTDTLINKFQSSLDVLEKKGIKKDLILNQSIITPACGMGTMKLEQAEEVANLLSELALELGGKY